MFGFGTRGTRVSTSRLAAGILVAAIAGATTGPALALGPEGSWTATYPAGHHPARGGHHHGHAPSGANVIGRGVGGLHGDFRAAHEMGVATGTLR